ncbi:MULTISPECIES: glycosyltransferase family 4 protein [unclassified Cedecea]|uniref:glycosyltransferase family 4 protein n=1 Tax=unclassified Cedecea TaxID=2649846 RepID=UPI003017ED85
MKKIAVIIPSVQNVGPVRVAYDIIEQLQNKYSVTSNVVYFEVFYLDNKGNMQFPCSQRKLTIKNFHKLYDFDVIHSHMIRPDFINAIIPFFKGKKVSTIHNIVETDLFYTYGKVVSFVFSKIWGSIWRHLDTKIVLTEVAREYYIKKIKIKGNEIEVINNGVKPLNKTSTFDKDIFDAVSNFRSKGLKVLGSIALFNKRKGLEQIIRVLAIDSELSCVIIGDGPIMNELKSLSESLDVVDRVYFTGFRDNGKEHIFLFDCYVMPSREEGFPLALTEALSSNVVTVCSDIPVFEEILDYNTTTFFKLDDIISLKKAVHHSISNSQRLANAAKIKFDTAYTREIMADKYLDIYLK